jgi:hypothetical protein
MVTDRFQKNNSRSSEAAWHLRKAGFALCKPDPGEKKPTYKGWPTRSLEPDDFRDGDLIGILGGPLSDFNLPGHALVPIDLDDALALEKADDFLPPTGMEEGRPGKERDHRYYLTPLASIPDWAFSIATQSAPAAIAAKGHPGPWKKGFNHLETQKRLIDFLGTGGQVVCPSLGANERQWVGGAPGQPAIYPFPDLWQAVCRLAEACGGKDLTPRASRPAREQTTPPRVKTSNELLRRIVAELARCDSAVSGHSGHNATYWPARIVCWGFDRGEEEGSHIMWRYFNPRCRPEWTEAELRHKCHDADTLPFDKPRGWLLAEPQSEPSAAETFAAAKQISRAIIDVIRADPEERLAWRQALQEDSEPCV